MQSKLYEDCGFIINLKGKEERTNEVYKGECGGYAV